MTRRTGDKISIAGDYQYTALNKGSAPQRFWHRTRLQEAIKDLLIKPGYSILDAGCGSGLLTAFIAEALPSVSITGIDGNAAAIDFCRRQWVHLPNARFIEGRIDELTAWPDAGTDGIAFLEVIEHITREQAFNVLREFHRILRPGGLLVVSTPNRKSLWPLQERIMDILRLVPRLKGAQHETLYSGAELEKMAASAGFATASRRTILFMGPWLATLSKRWADRMHRWETTRNRTPGSLLLYTFRK